jgi:NitT/TauT family transport system permease protein
MQRKKSTICQNLVIGPSPGQLSSDGSLLPVRQFVTGLRISLGVAWLVLVAVEMIAVNTGLGYLIIDARNAGKRYDLVVAGMLVMVLIGWLLDLLMREVERYSAVKWAYGIRHV